MKTAHDILRKRLLERAGVFDEKGAAPAKLTLPQIYKMQWSPEFEAAMRNRMAMGFFRYGALRDQIGKCPYDNIAGAKRRIELYLKDGNREHLVDAANLCLVEFAVHPEKPFSPVDDGEHTQLKKKDNI